MGLLELLILNRVKHRIIINEMYYLTLNKFIPLMVDEVREELANEYDVNNFWSDNYKYKGLCDKAAEKIINIVHESFSSKYPHIPIFIESVHGEQRHTLSLESKYWAYEHTWVHLRLFKYDFYIDPTCEQFQKLYDDMPEVYIGTTPPKWFLPDKKNWLWISPWKYINNRFRIKHKDQFGIHNMSILDYVVYVIWGRISDWIGSKLK